MYWTWIDRNQTVLKTNLWFQITFCIRIFKSFKTVSPYYFDFLGNNILMRLGNQFFMIKRNLLHHIFILVPILGCSSSSHRIDRSKKLQFIFVFPSLFHYLLDNRIQERIFSIVTIQGYLELIGFSGWAMDRECVWYVKWTNYQDYSSPLSLKTLDTFVHYKVFNPFNIECT